MAATTDPVRPAPAGRAALAARRRSGPAVLALALYGLVLAVFATFPVLDRMMRDAGRPDLEAAGWASVIGTVSSPWPPGR